ncbi:MAG: aminoacyl-tRNA hydrolase [Planctomycetes bacterium]|nr:aminoacyl-tRNA hydrolase [Planctomycetota bacterium]
MIRDLRLPGGRTLPGRLLTSRFSRSGGPGGQHVNKTETKADVRLDLAASAAILGGDAVARMRTRLAGRLDADGNVRVVCQEHRSRAQNLDAALSRMEALLAGALARPKSRRPTRPTRGSSERRLASKRARARIKSSRRAGGEE